MRRIWKWRLCAVSWVAGSYVCIMALISVINLTDPSEHRTALPAPTETVKMLTRIGQESRKSTRFIRPHSANKRVKPRASWGMAVARGSHKGSRLPWCKPLTWRTPPGPNTALVSFPGSGNTWLRYLLQQATGLYTGSVYKDYALLKNGFPAESVSNGTVLVVKTHEWGHEIRRHYSKAILLIRDPVQSILAEFNRQSGGHIGHAPSEKYKRDKGKYWEKFARTKALVWMNSTLDWLQFEGPIHLIFYEDLLNNLADEMRRIINFLDVSVTEAEFACMMKNKDGIYKRRKRKLPFEPFDKDLRLWIDKCRDVVNRTIKEHLAGNDVAEFISRTNITFVLPKDHDFKPIK